MAEPDKDTIYIDIDDEITGIIEKVHSSDGKVVALVLPKRASVFQSIVNMKLLKRATSEANKNLVLITTEAGLLPLAGAAGLYVASSLTSKPEIPTAPEIPTDIEEAVEEIDEDSAEITAENAGDKPVGELAGMGAATLPVQADDMETVELDNEESAEEAPTAAKPLPKKDKKLKVPNFERFRVLIFIGVLVLILLIVGLVFAMKVLPKAVISIETDATSISVDQNIKLSTTAKSVHLSDGTLPAKLDKQPKTYTQQVPTTGQKNNGNKATGKVTLINCSTTDDITYAAGSGFSSGGKTYITQQTVTVPTSSFNKSSCQHNGTASVTVAAQNGGSGYNLASGATFSVSHDGSVVSAQGDTISGGTDNIVQVVSDNDIVTAKSKINATDPTIKQSLSNSLTSEGYYAISATFVGGTPSSTNSANVGDAASSVTVTETINYSMFGVKKDDLKSLIAHAAKEQIDTSKQSILDDGVSGAVFNVTTQSDTDAELSLHTEISAGPQLDVSVIKQQSAGKKSGDIKTTLQANPDVTNVEVKLSPFWVNSVPNNTSKITVNIAKPKPAPTNKNAN